MESRGVSASKAALERDRGAVSRRIPAGDLEQLGLRKPAHALLGQGQLVHGLRLSRISLHDHMLPQPDRESKEIFGVVAPGSDGIVCRQQGCSLASAKNECTSESKTVCGTPVKPWVLISTSGQRSRDPAAGRPLEIRKPTYSRSRRTIHSASEDRAATLCSHAMFFTRAVRTSTESRAGTATFLAPICANK
jgi:hypothetical protein